MCILQNIQAHPPQGRSLGIPRGRESQKPKFVKESMTLNWKFLGVGVQTKKTFSGGMDIFWNNTLYGNVMSKSCMHLPLLRLRDLSDNAVAKASSSPGLVLVFGEANNDSSYKQQKGVFWCFFWSHGR